MKHSTLGQHGASNRDSSLTTLSTTSLTNSILETLSSTHTRRHVGRKKSSANTTTSIINTYIEQDAQKRVSRERACFKMLLRAQIPSLPRFSLPRSSYFSSCFFPSLSLNASYTPSSKALSGEFSFVVP